MRARGATRSYRSPSVPRLPWPADDPYPTYASSRAERGDVFFDHDVGAWIVLGYEPARAVLRGNGWSSDPTANPALARQVAESGVGTELFGQFLLFLDPPEHTRIRGALRHAFTPSAVGALAERIDAIIRATVDPLPTDEPFDVMAEVARPLPIAVISEWLDLGIDGAELLWSEAPALVRLLDLDVTAAPVDLAGAAGSFTALIAHLLPLASERRRNPGNDLLSVMASDPSLNLEEVVMNALLIAIAGHETTANLVGNSLHLLLSGQDGQREVLIDDALADREALPDASIDELLRLAGPVQAVGRTATADHELSEQTIRAGDRVLAVIAAANRDPSVYADPDRFARGRSGPPPLAFGLGRHHCLGAALARLETGSTLGRLLARRPALAGDGLTCGTNRAIRGPERLEISLAA